MVLDQTKQKSPSGESERTIGHHSTTLQKTTNHLVQRNARGAHWTWKTVTIVVDSGAAENVMPKSIFTEISREDTERSKNGMVFKRPREERIKNCGQQAMSVRTSEGVVRKSTWQVADVRRLFVSDKNWTGRCHFLWIFTCTCTPLPPACGVNFVGGAWLMPFESSSNSSCAYTSRSVDEISILLTRTSCHLSSTGSSGANHQLSIASDAVRPMLLSIGLPFLGKNCS